MHELKIGILVATLLMVGFYFVGFYAEDKYVLIEDKEEVSSYLTKKAEILLSEKEKKRTLALVDVSNKDGSDNELIEKESKINEDDLYDIEEIGDNIAASALSLLDGAKLTFNKIVRPDNLKRNFEDDEISQKEVLSQQKSNHLEIIKNDKLRKLSTQSVKQTLGLMDGLGNNIIDFFRFEDIRKRISQKLIGVKVSLKEKNIKNREQTEIHEVEVVRNTTYSKKDVENYNIAGSLVSLSNMVKESLPEIVAIDNKSWVVSVELEDRVDRDINSADNNTNQLGEFGRKITLAALSAMVESGEMIINFFQFNSMNLSDLGNFLHISNKETHPPEGLQHESFRDFINVAVDDLHNGPTSLLSSSVKGLDLGWLKF